MTRIKTGDIVYLPFDDEYEHIFEVGPGKLRTNDENSNSIVCYEVYPIVRIPDENKYIYATDPIWINKKEISEHYAVRNAIDFYHAWASLGFDVCTDNSNISFHKLFDYEPNIDDACVESLSSQSDEEYEEIRSMDSYSTTTDGSESNDSFITNTLEESNCEYCDNNECSFCKDIKDTNRWFDHQWVPDKESDEFKIKSVIENIEHKYT